MSDMIRVGTRFLNMSLVSEVRVWEDGDVDIRFVAPDWSFDAGEGRTGDFNLRLSGESARAFVAYLDETSFDVSRWYEMRQGKGESHAA
jgi:hypothetical protein